MRKLVLIFWILLCFNIKAQHIANYVSNGSFEDYRVCSAPPTYTWNVINWNAQTHDTSCFSFGFFSTCLNRVPYWGAAYQYPRSGDSYISLSVVYGNNYWKAYAKNRLKRTLQAGKTYCVKFYVNISNGSTYGIDGIGAYFFGNAMDTMTICYTMLTLSYITPQVQNPQGNIITDTLNWIAITGTFTANGTEKYLLLGNFLSDENTETLMINPTHLPAIYTEIGIDDVSCIPIDLGAYAGRDTTIFLNDSVYIGRENDFAIDTGCVWYKLPSTTAIDTISGMWVKPPIGTHTYVVRQELECSPLKWDTVVVNVKEKIIDTTGIEEYEIRNWSVEIFPNPAQNEITLRSKNESEDLDIVITDILNRKLLDKRVKINAFVTSMELNLINGAYVVTITNKQNKTIAKKLLIAK